jgi:hypothetical protein
MFSVIISIFFQGVYPFWLLLILAEMFAQFLLTSSRKAPRYDMLGKYYGVFLFAAIAVTLVFPLPSIITTIFVCIVIFTGAVLISRFAR